jgi:prephenate dehydrogenase
MFGTRHVNLCVTLPPKPLKLNNVLVNVVVVVTTHSQQLEQHVLKDRKLVKAKGAKDWQREERLHDSFVKIVKQLQRGGTNKQPTITNKEPL